MPCTERTHAGPPLRATGRLPDDQRSRRGVSTTILRAALEAVDGHEFESAVAHPQQALAFEILDDPVHRLSAHSEHRGECALRAGDRAVPGLSQEQPGHAALRAAVQRPGLRLLRAKVPTGHSGQPGRDWRRARPGNRLRPQSRSARRSAHAPCRPPVGPGGAARLRRCRTTAVSRPSPGPVPCPRRVPALRCARSILRREAFPGRRRPVLAGAGDVPADRRASGPPCRRAAGNSPGIRRSRLPSAVSRDPQRLLRVRVRSLANVSLPWPCPRPCGGLSGAARAKPSSAQCHARHRRHAAGRRSRRRRVRHLIRRPGT